MDQRIELAQQDKKYKNNCDTHNLYRRAGRSGIRQPSALIGGQTGSRMPQSEKRACREQREFSSERQWHKRPDHLQDNGHGYGRYIDTDTACLF
ncbi:hypothetical protein SDC9_58592 [bioreactor metagenome]|uniref:Uncharacterized protein n=1 Tax=bioreactor metagenome TaxID=1076179 RepID=A0A644X7U3_9ZZZZ